MADSKISDLTATTLLDDEDEFVVASAGTSKKIDALYMPGFQLAYAEITSPVTVSATSAASPTDVVSSGALTYAAERIRIEFFSPLLEPGATAASYLIVSLWDDTTDLGRFAVAGHSTTALAPQSPCFAVRYLTPSAASHTYRIRAYRSVSNGTIGAGTGGTDAVLPAFVRVSRA